MHPISRPQRTDSDLGITAILAAADMYAVAASERFS